MDGFDQLIEFPLDAEEQIKRHRNRETDLSDETVQRFQFSPSFWDEKGQTLIVPLWNKGRTQSSYHVGVGQMGTDPF